MVGHIGSFDGDSHIWFGEKDNYWERYYLETNKSFNDCVNYWLIKFNRSTLLHSFSLNIMKHSTITTIKKVCCWSNNKTRAANKNLNYLIIKKRNIQIKFKMENVRKSEWSRNYSNFFLQLNKNTILWFLFPNGNWKKRFINQSGTSCEFLWWIMLSYLYPRIKRFFMLFLVTLCFHFPYINGCVDDCSFISFYMSNIWKGLMKSYFG